MIPVADQLNRTIIDAHLNDLQLARKTRSALQQIRTISKSLPVIALLTTVPGVGLLTAFTLYVELVDIQRFPNFDKLASYVGLIPSVQSSDETVTVRGITERHCRHLRSILIESAWIAIRNDEALLHSFNQLIKLFRSQMFHTQDS